MDFGKVISFFSNCYEVEPEDKTTVRVVLSMINSNTFKGLIEEYRKEVSPEVRKKLKLRFPCVTFSGQFETRSASGLVSPSNIIIADCDNIQGIHGIKTKMRTDKKIAFFFESPSKGLKVGFYYPIGMTHDDAFYSMKSYIKIYYYLNIDESGKDISRLCFVSHDPDMYVNENAEPIELVDKPKMERDSQEDVKRIVFNQNRSIVDIYNSVLSKLKGLKVTNQNKAIACCPAHNDSNPSFSVNLINGEKILMYCHAGCSFSSIAEALEIPKEDFFAYDKPISDNEDLKTKSERSSVVITNYSEIKLPKPNKDGSVRFGSVPLDVLQPYGVLNEIVDNICKSAIKPQRFLSIGAVLAMGGALLGKKYEFQRTKANIYVLNVAPSSGGKDHPRKWIKGYFQRTGLEHINPVDRLTSDVGVYRVVRENSSSLVMMDEFGKLLKGLTESRSSYAQNVITALTDIYSASSSYVAPAAKARYEEGEDSVIYQPHLCLLGSTVPERLFESLTKEHIIDGFLARFLFFYTDDNPLFSGKDVSIDYDTSIIELIKSVYLMSPKQTQGTIISPDPYKMKASDACIDILRDYDDFLNSRPLDDFKPIWDRSREGLRKVAMIVSVLNSNIDIDENCLLYSVKLVKYCTELLCKLCERFISRTITEQTYNELKEYIYSRYIETNGTPIRYTEISKRFKHLKSKELQERLSYLIDTEDLNSVDLRLETGKLIKIYFPFR